MAGIDSLTAAQLSQAAYIPKASYVAGTEPAGIVPSGWGADTSLSVVVGNNQFIVFVNDATQQVVVGFKGSDSASQLRSDILDIARHDEVLWENLKDRELNQFNEDGSAKLPSLAMLVEDFVKQEQGADHIFDTGSLMIQLRYQTRQELGLPV